MERLLTIAQIITTLAGAFTLVVVVGFLILSAISGLWFWIEGLLGRDRYENPHYKVRRNE